MCVPVCVGIQTSTIAVSVKSVKNHDAMFEPEVTQKQDAKKDEATGECWRKFIVRKEIPITGTLY